MVTKAGVVSGFMLESEIMCNSSCQSTQTDKHGNDPPWSLLELTKPICFIQIKLNMLEQC